MEKRQRLGAISAVLKEKQKEDNHSAVDQGAEMTKPYMAHLMGCIKHHAALGQCKAYGICDCDKKYDIKTPSGTIRGDFYVTVLTKKERLMQNVIRNYFIPRVTCPTPDFDQTVFKYHADSEAIEYLWTIPSLQACQRLKEFPLDLPPEEKQLLRFVLDFYDDTLLEKAKRLNGEIQ